MTTHVQIQGTTPRIQYISNGSLTTYEFPFAVFSAGDINVYFDDTLQADTTYTVSGIRSTTGGSVTLTAAPAQGVKITIVRNLSIERTSDFQEGGALRADILNDELDYQIACQQQIADGLNRSMTLPPYAISSNVDLTLPTPMAGKAIVWNSTGTNLENSTVAVNSLEATLKAYKEAAESASSTAATEATAAATSATTAANSATTAANSASAAAASATAAAAAASSVPSDCANQNLSNITSAAKASIFASILPSTSYVNNIFDSTVSTTDSTYTAPADGYCFAVCAKSGGAIQFSRNNRSIGYGGSASSSEKCYFGVFIPCKSGDVIKYHTTTGTGSIWESEFYYAEGTR